MPVAKPRAGSQEWYRVPALRLPWNFLNFDPEYTLSSKAQETRWEDLESCSWSPRSKQLLVWKVLISEVMCQGVYQAWELGGGGSILEREKVSSYWWTVGTLLGFKE